MVSGLGCQAFGSAFTDLVHIGAGYTVRVEEILKVPARRLRLPAFTAFRNAGVSAGPRFLPSLSSGLRTVLCLEREEKYSQDDEKHFTTL